MVAATKLISVLIPTFNEEDNAENAYSAVKKVFEEKLPKYKYEIIFTDNRSTDNTYEVLKRIAGRDPNVRVARFSRNFGFNKSLLTAYNLSKGDAAIQLDCDLQDPPELFVKFIELWEKGHDVVVGLRQNRPEPRWLLALRKTFYRFLARISDDNLAIDGGDFRLVDRSVINRMVQVYDATPYVRGLASAFASNPTGVPYLRKKREHGKSKFPLVALVGLATDGILSHSVIPLRLASLFGYFAAAVTFLLAMSYLIARLFFSFYMPVGFATSIILELLSISINAIFLGILGEYLARMHQNLRRRPITIISDTLNFPDQENT